MCVDPELFEGCGPCVDICPELFELNDEGIAVVLLDEVPEEFLEACMAAEDILLGGVISIEVQFNLHSQK